MANVSDAPVNIGDYVVVALVDDPRRSLSPDGPYVGSDGTDMQLLFGAETCDERPFPDQPADLSWSRQADGGWCDTLPSPGRANHPCLWSAR